MIEFIEYPDEGARNGRRDGVLLKGQVISDAPPSGQWVLVPGTRTYHRVFGLPNHLYQGRYLKSSIATENWSHS